MGMEGLMKVQVKVLVTGVVVEEDPPQVPFS